MTQKARADRVVDALKKHAEPLKELEQELDRILCEAQNRPPEGASDGSMTPKEWGDFHALREAVEELVWRLS